MKNTYSFTFLRGLKQHYACADELNRLRKATGQDGNASTDPVWFAINSIDSRRRPWTILMLEDGKPVGAMMLREQTRFGIPLGYFFACDAAADEFIIASDEERANCLRLCIEALTRRKPSAIVFLATRTDYSRAGWNHLKRCSGEGNALYRLPLLATLDETYRQFGPHTRRNLRYYARNARRYGATFYPDLTDAELTEAALELRPDSDYPITARGLKSIFEAVGRLESGYSAGLRGPDGEWLSIITGWRDGGMTSIFFQMNHITFRKLSLSTAMRALWIEHEIERGATDLAFVAYPSEVIERGCAKDPRFDLLLARPSWRLLLLEWAALRLPADHRLRQCVERSQKDRLAGRRKLDNVHTNP